MKTETPLSIIMRNQKPSLLARFFRLLATPFVLIYNSIKSRNECRQEIPSNFANSKLVTFYTRGEVLQGGDLYNRDNDNPLAGDRGSIQTKPRSDENSEIVQKETSNELKIEEKIDTPSLTVPELSKREKSGFFQKFTEFFTNLFSKRTMDTGNTYISYEDPAESISQTANGQPLSAQPFQERRFTPTISHEEAIQKQPTNWSTKHPSKGTNESFEERLAKEETATDERGVKHSIV